MFESVRVFSILSLFLFRQGFTWAFTQCFYENGSRCFHVNRFWSCVLRITPRTPHQWWNAWSIFSNWVSKIQLLHFISYQFFCFIIFLDYHYLLCYDLFTIYLSWFYIQLQYKVILHFFSESLKEIELTKFKITTSKREYVTKHKLGKQPMMAETRVMLENLYRPDTEELSRLLKDKRFLWISRDNKSGITENFTINKI